MESKTRLSYIHAPSTESYIYQSVPDRLRQLAADDPEREAFVFYNYAKQRLCLTRKQVLDQSTNVAKHLVKLGLKKGTTVSFCMGNSLEMLVAMLGVTIAGGIPFFLSPNLKDGSDLIEMINSLKGELLIVDTTEGDANWNIIENVWPEKSACSEKIPSLKLILCNSASTSFTESPSRKLLAPLISEIIDEEVELPTVLPEDHLAYFCSSGSTGQPKKVVYTHFGIMNWTQTTDKMLGITNESRMFCDRTFSWVLGYPRTYFTEGTTRVFVDNRMTIAGAHVELLCDIIEKEKCDIVFMPGYIASDVCKKPGLEKKFKYVDLIYMGGERVKLASSNSLCGKYCKRFATYFGSTESGGALTYLNDFGPFEDGIVGKPLEGMEVKIVDESGQVVPYNTQGEVCLRSTWRFETYLDDDNKFRETVDSKDWFHVGDIGRLREDGNIVIHGRIKEWISSGTMKFFPWETERVLSKIPGAGQVFAVGVPDERLLQVICACVVPKPDVTLTVEDVKAFCDDTFLDESTALGVSSKPRYYIILNTVPLTRTGKIDRRTIGIQAKEMLGL